MTNKDLKNAKDEILRLKLLLGMKIDGGFEEEDDDKLRQGMLKRMGILDEIGRMKDIKDELEESYKKYELHFDNHERVEEDHQKNCNEMNELNESVENNKKEIDETTQLIKDLTKKISEARDKKNKLEIKLNIDTREWNQKKDRFMHIKNHLPRYKELMDLSEKEYDKLEKEFINIMSKFNPGKRKEMESLVGNFEVKMDISGKRVRCNAM